MCWNAYTHWEFLFQHTLKKHKEELADKRICILKSTKTYKGVGPVTKNCNSLLSLDDHYQHITKVHEKKGKPEENLIDK